MINIVRHITTASNLRRTYVTARWIGIRLNFRPIVIGTKALWALGTGLGMRCAMDGSADRQATPQVEVKKTVYAPR